MINLTQNSVIVQALTLSRNHNVKAAKTQVINADVVQLIPPSDAKPMRVEDGGVQTTTSVPMGASGAAATSLAMRSLIPSMIEDWKSSSFEVKE